MQTCSRRIRYRSRKAEFKLFPIGDIHAGTIACCEDRIREKVKEIKEDPFALWVGMGDYGEFIAPSDPRWDWQMIADWVEPSNIAECQRRWIANLLLPIKGQCLGLLMGNHENKIRQRNYQDVHLDLCRDLGVPNLGYSCFYRLFFTRNRGTFTVDCHFEHGSGGAQTEGGKIMRLSKAMLAFDSDIIAMGHLHDIKINAIPMLYMDKEYHIKQKVKVGAITGSWFRAYMEGPYPTYAEVGGYNPVNLGCPHFIIRPDKAQIAVSGGP